MVELTDGLTEETATYRADPQANTIAWLLWHLTRIQDDHVAGLAGVAAALAGLAGRVRPAVLGLGDRLRTRRRSRSERSGSGGELLAGYHADVHQLTLDYLDSLHRRGAARVVDTNWDPPVTAAVRLVSVLGDVLQHLGQAGYVRGLAERHSQAWHDSAAADR